MKHAAAIVQLLFVAFGAWLGYPNFIVGAVVGCLVAVAFGFVVLAVVIARDYRNR